MYNIQRVSHVKPLRRVPREKRDMLKMKEELKTGKSSNLSSSFN